MYYICHTPTTLLKNRSFAYIFTSDYLIFRCIIYYPDCKLTDEVLAFYQDNLLPCILHFLAVTYPSKAVTDLLL